MHFTLNFLTLFYLHLCILPPLTEIVKVRQRAESEVGEKSSAFRHELSSYRSMLVFDKDLLPRQHGPNSQTWNCHALTSGAGGGCEDGRKGGCTERDS